LTIWATLLKFLKSAARCFTSLGPFITRYLQSKGKKVFLDLKFHDIPNTVASAVKSAVGLSLSPNNDSGFAPLFMLTVHTCGGKEMLEAAVQAGESQAKALGVPRAVDRRCHCVDQHGKGCQFRKF